MGLIKPLFDMGVKSEYNRFWDIHQSNGTRNIYTAAFAGWIGENFKPKYKITPKGLTVALYMFYGFNRVKAEMFDMTPYNNMIDFSGVTNATNMFADAWVKNLYCDLSSCIDATNVFASTNSCRIENITLKVTNKLTRYYSSFVNQTYISKLFFTEDSEIVADISFANSTRLTNESVQSIINALSSVTPKTITFHSTVVNNLTNEQITQIAEKGWSLG